MEHSIYLAGIKQALRARGVMYADLAGHLKMTESGVKKMLNGKDISFRRVLQICDLLDVLPGQLFSLSEQSEIPEVHFTGEQQEALIKSRYLLSVYWRFAIEKRSVIEIEKLEKMSGNDLKKYMQRLVELKLIKSSRGQFHNVHHGKFRWSDDSKLAQFLNQQWSELTLRRALRARNEEGSLHRLSSIRMARESYDEIIKKLSAILTEAAQISSREEIVLSSRDLLSTTLLVAAVPRGVFDAD